MKLAKTILVWFFMLLVVVGCVTAITLGIDLAGAEALAVENIQNAINSLGDRLVISDIPTIKNITSMLADAEEKGYDLSGLQNLDRYEVAEGKLTASLKEEYK